MGLRGTSHGEKIAIAKLVTGFTWMGNPEWIIKKGVSRYAEALKPVIWNAYLIIVSRRNRPRLRGN